MTVTLTLYCENHCQGNCPNLEKCKQEMIEKFQRKADSLHDDDPVEILLKDGCIITMIRFESIHFDVFCPTVDAMYNLYQRYVSGDLDKHFNMIVDIEALRNKNKDCRISLKVEIKDEMLDMCRADIEDAEGRDSVLCITYLHDLIPFAI